MFIWPTWVPFYSPVVAHPFPFLDVLKMLWPLFASFPLEYNCLHGWLHSLWAPAWHEQVQPRLSIWFWVGEILWERKFCITTEACSGEFSLPLPCYCLHSVVRPGRAGPPLCNDAFRSKKYEMLCVVVFEDHTMPSALCNLMPLCSTTYKTKLE